MSASVPQINQVVLAGNLTANPILKQLDGDKCVCNLRLAVNDRDQHPTYVDVSTFGPQAKACAKYLKRGSAIGVTGRLVFREWEDNEGRYHSKHSVIGRVIFGGHPDNDNGDAASDEDRELVAATPDPEDIAF
jgi:single-strand DNA-binding protein